MNRKPAVVLFVLFILLIAPVYADWTLVEQTGEWEICERTYWHKKGWNEGYAEWCNEGVTDFNGYWFKVNTTKWDNWREWWQFGIIVGETSNDFEYRIKIETETATLWIRTKYHGWTAWFGLLQGRQVFIGASIDASDWNDIVIKYPGFEGYDYWTVRHYVPDDFQIFVVSEAQQVKVYWFFDIPGQERDYAVQHIFNASLGATANVTLIYQHGGQGEIIGYAYDSFDLPSFPPYEFKGSAGSWMDLFTWLATLDYYGIISTLIVCLSIFVSFVQLSLPLLGFFVLFWILACIASAVVHGEPRIIGDMMMRIYDFVRGVWQTLVNIANAIWDFITFWS